MLVEGNSMRATARMAGVSFNTLSKLLLDIGEATATYQDEHLRGLDCKAIEADEVWSFVAHKERNKPEELHGTFGTSDTWTWTALDADSKLIVCWYVGDRKYEDAAAFMTDLADRVTGPIQLTTDGHRAYPNARSGWRCATTSTSRSSSRLTPPTRMASKKLDNHMAAIALHFLHDNFARPHKTLAKPYPRTPAMVSGIADHVWSLTEIVRLLPN
jgi:IS1 family transposase